MIDYPSLLPAPRRWEEHPKQFAAISALPLTVSGVRAKVLEIVNKIVRNLPSLDPPAKWNPTGRLPERIPLQETGRDEALPFIHAEGKSSPGGAPEVLVQLGEGTAPKFAAKDQFGFYAEQIRQQAYRLTVLNRPLGSDQPAALIQAETEIAVQYALLSLLQIIRRYGRHLPGVTIEDAPLFKHRGYMLDVSRDRVPLMGELEKLIDLLASLKYNHFQLYTEHTFAYIGHEEVWREASPLTPEEFRRLDGYCAERGIVLAANQNCFGHLARWLKHPRYQHLAETNGEWSFLGFKRSGPHSLCPTDPGSLALVEDMLDQLLPNFSSGLVNVGCDETFDVGQGRSAEMVAAEGAFKVNWRFVNQVLQAARDRGFRPLLWADLLLHEEAPANLEIGDAIPLVWGYEPNMPWRNWLWKTGAAWREVWVCPGTSSWNSIIGRTSERFINLSEAAREGAAGGAAGILVTEWGDFGHRQQHPITLLGLAAGACAAWSENFSEADLRSCSLPVFGDWSDRIGDYLCELGNLDKNIRAVAGKPSESGAVTALRNRTFLFDEMERSLRAEYRPVDRSLLEETRQKLESLPSVAEITADPLIVEEVRHTLRVARWALEKSFAVRFTAGDRPLVWARLRSELAEITAEHRRLWLARSRPGGLEDSSRYYETLMRDIDAEV